LSAWNGHRRTAEAWQAKRGALGWLVSAVLGLAGGLALLLLLVNLGKVPFSEGRSASEWRAVCRYAAA
jgi:hypothetical protein